MSIKRKILISKYYWFQSNEESETFGKVYTMNFIIYCVKINNLIKKDKNIFYIDMLLRGFDYCCHLEFLCSINFLKHIFMTVNDIII